MKKVSIILMISCIVIILSLSFLLCIYIKFYRSHGDFDIGQFKSRGYTQEEIELFNDIAFYDRKRIIKWKTDIKVQEIGKAGPKCASLDSVIKVLTPLIAPLTIKRVTENGNLLVLRGLGAEEIDANGYASKNGIPVIERARIRESKYANYRTLMHEFEHILGLTHSQKVYTFPVNMCIAQKKLHKFYHIGEERPEQPLFNHFYFDTWDDFAESLDHPERPEMLSKQEATVIRMLYSPDIKPGLRRTAFMKALGLKDDEKE